MDAIRKAAAPCISRGVCRLLAHMGFSPMTEFRLTSKRRVDVMGLDKGGHFLIAEIKSSLADFRADGKWTEYPAYGDLFYFAVGPEFPREVLPEGVGVMIADAHGAEILSQAQEAPLNAARRKAQIQRFAFAAANRLHRLDDPGFLSLSVAG
ncbi:MAG: MmcB family DNA repair protein [Rhodospirillales bacterium]|jgi:hypothetical protein|nr:MmcB family DNA repair protein [Rhodospirillales bacterium]